MVSRTLFSVLLVSSIQLLSQKQATPTSGTSVNAGYTRDDDDNDVLSKKKKSLKMALGMSLKRFIKLISCYIFLHHLSVCCIKMSCSKFLGSCFNPWAGPPPPFFLGHDCMRGTNGDFLFQHMLVSWRGTFMLWVGWSGVGCVVVPIWG